MPPPCPDCSTVTERIEVEGEEVWRCTASDCTRRTYGTGKPDDDEALPPYTETDETGTVFACHGTGEVDVEATAELAAQDGPGEDDDLDDEEQPPPATAAPGAQSIRGTGRVPGAAKRGNDLPGWGRLPTVEHDPYTEDAPTAFTDSDGGVGHDPRRPHPGVGHDPAPPCPTSSPRRPG
ncbi:hypothetical protein ACFWHG_33795 [Streptomyces microflavus]|uniref:hypothetical protein n=1 Tax=Streptomyces microflavus TaxID=1919 RepID=UPI003667F858